MGLIGNFFGLLFSGGYTAHTLLSEKESNKEYDVRKESAHQSFVDLNTLLQDRELERVVADYVGQGKNNQAIKEMLRTELEYISGGDNSVVDYLFSNERNAQANTQQKIDLLMSKFGKQSSLRLMFKGTRFGNLDKISRTIDSYEESIRVLQCIESNLYHTTSRKVLFGVQENERCFNGKYCSAPIVLIGTTINKVKRVYNAIDIPFEPISKEDLLK